MILQYKKYQQINFIKAILFMAKEQSIQLTMKMLQSLLYLKKNGILAKYKQKKNARHYERTATYLFINKLKCSKCGCFLGGCASTKPSGKKYYYYKCKGCKAYYTEKDIEESLILLFNELLRQDNLLNDYYTQFIKSELDNSEIDFNKEIKHIDFKREELLNKQKEQKQYEILSFTLDDLLILEDKQEIEMFTKPDNYLKDFYKWDGLEKQEKQRIIAKYIDNLTTLKTNNKINIINGEFRSSYLKDLIDNHNNYSVPFNLRLFKDEYGCYLNMNHEVKSKEEVKNYFDKLCSTLNEYKFNYYEIDTDDDLKDIKYSSNINLEKIIRLISIKPDKGFKNQNLKLGVITLDLSNIPNISNETYSKIFKDLKEKFKNELESQKT